MRSIYTILQSVSESLPKQEQSTWCQSVSRTLKSRRVDGWGPHFCAQNCEAHHSLHQQCPRGSHRLAWRVKNWYALVNGVMNGTCSNTTKKTSLWVGWVAGWVEKEKRNKQTLHVKFAREGAWEKMALRWSVNKILQRWKHLEHPCWHEFKVAVADCIQKIEEEPVEVEHAHWCTS